MNRSVDCRPLSPGVTGSSPSLLRLWRTASEFAVASPPAVTTVPDVTGTPLGAAPFIIAADQLDRRLLAAGDQGLSIKMATWKEI